jgi:hypothetical protein
LRRGAGHGTWKAKRVYYRFVLLSHTKPANHQAKHVGEAYYSIAKIAVFPRTVFGTLAEARAEASKFKYTRGSNLQPSVP